MSGVGSSRVPEGRVTGDTEPGTDTVIWWGRRMGIPEALMGKQADSFWGAPEGHGDGTEVAQDTQGAGYTGHRI